MAGMVPKYQRDGTWVYLPIRVALEMVGLEDTGVYIARRQNMAAQYIAARPIMELCLEVDQKPEMRLSRRWRENPTLYIMGIRAGQASAEEGGEEMGVEELEAEGEED